MIDWNALGTWAAVVVALRISLQETWYRRRERSGRHLVVTDELYPAVSMLHDPLQQIIRDCARYESWDDAELLANGNDAFEAVFGHLNLEPFRSR